MGNNGRVFGGGILFWIVFLLALIFSVGFCQAAVSHDFNTTITVTPSTGGGLMIDLIEPAAAVFSGISEISFRAVVTYNRSIGLWCNLSLDNSVLASLEILDGQELIVENITTITQGNHSWLMSCTDELNNNYTSSIKQFVVDLEAPSIYLNKEDPALSLIDAIRLNFTVTDNIATSLLCNLSASGRGVNNVYAAAGLVINVTLAGLDNGDYFWNVSCVDTAGNLNISKNKKFIINTQSNFTIKRNKDLYTLGESGIYILEAPQGSQITIVITTPKLTTVIRNYVGPYPVIDNISFAEYEGTYLIQGFLNYMGAIKTIESSFEVKNTLETSIRLDRNTILRGESISFSSHSSGGLGGRDYTWDFGDQTATATGESVSHTYNKLGNFTVSLNIKDSKGNVASDTATIRVAELYSVDIIVIADETSSVLDGVKVRLNQDERTTDAYGRVNYMILPGDYELVVKRDPYKTVIRQLNISGSATIGVRMKKIDYSEIIKEVETQNQGAGVNAKTNTSGSPDSNTNTADNAGGSTDSNPLSSGDYNSYFSEIESAISIINGYDSEMQKLTEKLNLKYNLEKARQSLTMADRDLGILRDPRKQVSADEFKVRAAEISKNVNKTMDGVVKSLTISDSKEFVSYPTDKEIDLIARGYVNFTKVRFDRAKTDYYVRYVKGIQDSIQYNAVIKNAKMEYLSGRTEEITIFLVEISAEEPLSDKSLLVYLPKEVVKGAGDIVAITDYSVVAADPIIGFGLNDNRYLLFYVKGYVDPAVGKGVKFVLAQAPDKVEFTNKGIGITGSAIFSSISNIENPVVVIEVLAIVILLIVYLIYQFDLIAKIRILIVLRDKELEGITGHIRDIERLIEKNEAENSYMAYDDMIKVYNNLPEKARAKVEPKTKELYQRIVMMDINNQLNLAFAVLQDNKRDEARAGYKKVMELYKRLTEENRREIIERAKTLFERVSAG